MSVRAGAGPLGRVGAWLGGIVVVATAMALSLGASLGGAVGEGIALAVLGAGGVLGVSTLLEEVRRPSSAGHFVAVGRASRRRRRHLVIDAQGMGVVADGHGEAVAEAAGPVILGPGLAGPPTVSWADLSSITLSPRWWPYPSTYVVVSMTGSVTSWSLTVRGRWSRVLGALRAQAPGLALVGAEA